VPRGSFAPTISAREISNIPAIPAQTWLQEFGVAGQSFILSSIYALLKRIPTAPNSRRNARVTNITMRNARSK
jgi:hypothetical protein